MSAFRMLEVNNFRQGINFDHLKSEAARLQSFSEPPGWHISFIRPEDCARAGLFFLRDADKVQCTFCKGVIGDWNIGDDPMTEHRRHFTCCPYVCGLQVGNIPFNEESAGAASLDNQDHTSASNIGEKERSTKKEEADTITSLAIKICGNGPVHHDLVTFSSRINTFTNWPLVKRQTPHVLAEAGFFYCGRRDDVRCFYCNGGLNEWLPLDDPWVEHARWFSNCTYIILIKGEEFVKKIHEIRPPLRFECQEMQSHEQNVYKPRVFSYEEIQELMRTPIVQAALEMGTDSHEIFKALLIKIKRTGEPFLTSEALIEAVYQPNSTFTENSDSDSESNSESNSVSDSETDIIEVDEDEFVLLRPINNSSERPSTNSVNMGLLNDAASNNNVEPIAYCATRQSTYNTDFSGRSSDELVTPNSSSYEQVEYAQEAIFVQEKDSEQKEKDVCQHNVCKICMDSQIEIVFLPCGHLVCCTRCATTLSVCAICRKRIVAVVRAYFS